MSGKSSIITRIVRVTEIRQETTGAKSFVLECLNGNISYRSGQFLTFLFRNIEGEEVRRSYSISSCPELNEPLTITVKRIPNGEFSRMFVEKIRVGDQLETIGASGFFVLPEIIDKVPQLIFFAAGSGITPIFSLLKSVLPKCPSVKTVLFYSNTDIVTTIFFRELQELQIRYNQNFRLVFLFSMSRDLARSRLSPESMKSIMENHQVSGLEKSLFYVCGPGAYMRMINFKLLSFGVPADRIKREIFHVQQPVVTLVPPDTKSYTITLFAEGKQYQFPVQYPTTILRAAKLLNIPIPYSCETGQCGTCVAKRLHGQVWMSRNEVLLDEELSIGRVLTCTGYPVYGDVTLKL